MDLHFTAALANEEECAAIDAALGPAAGVPRGDRAGADRPPADGAAARKRRHLLLPALRAVSSRVGWISEGALNEICRRLTVPPAEAYGVASFYHMFSLSPRPPALAYVCDDIACAAAGAGTLCAQLEQTLGAPGKPALGGAATWQRSPCLGACDRAPAALVTVAGPRTREQTIAPARAADLAAALRSADVAAAPSPTRLPQSGSRQLRILRRIAARRDLVPSLDAYAAGGGYAALRRALEIGPDAVIREVIESKLVGRGGAAFPTGRKWEAVARMPAQPHYLVCNADESEPGTFKDRILMEEDPNALIEAMTIAAYAGRCERGFLYIRGEYPLAAARMTSAIEQARAKGLLGGDILGKGLRFDVELRRGAGAYICGEETALFNSIEGRRGEPRSKPPFPTERGLFGAPTIENNVETLFNVLDIVLEGGAAFAAIGTPESTGTKLFCVCGQVSRPGVYEVPFGTTLRALIELADGVPTGRRLQAALLGGAAGVFVTPAELDTPLSYAGVRAIGATLGSGAVIVFDDSTDMRTVLVRIAEFFRDESCGQCVPCRVGTLRQEELLHRLAAGTPLGSAHAERALLADIARAMRDASICGLGQTASSAIESALAKFDPFAGSRSG